MNVVLNRTLVVDWHFNNLCSSHLQSQSELYHVSWWYQTLVIDLIGQLSRDFIGRLSVKLWCYWLWRLVISLLCFDPSIVKVKQLFIVAQIVTSPENDWTLSTTTVLFRTTFTQTIILNLLMKWLLGSNLSVLNKKCLQKEWGVWTIFWQENLPIFLWQGSKYRQVQTMRRSRQRRLGFRCTQYTWFSSPHDNKWI